MEISIRSQLATGVAFAGAAAIAVVPVVQPETAESLRRVTADVQLTWVNPVSELVASLNLGTNYLFATDTAAFPYLQGQVLQVIPQNPRPIPPIPTLYVIGQGATAPLGWMPQLFGGWSYTTKIFEDTAGTQPAPPPFDAVTTTTVGGFPLTSAVATNLSGYLDAAVLGLSGLVGGVGAAAFAIPFAAVQIVADLVAGRTLDFQAILDTIVTPITDGVGAAVSAATYILTNLTTRVTRALPLLPAVGVALVQQAVASAVYLGNSLVTTFGDAIRDLPDVELAFDAVAQGLLGPNGFVGNVVELTVGRGVATGTPETPFIPSVRSLVSGVTGGTSQDIVNPTAPSALAGASVLSASAEPAAGLDASIARGAVGDNTGTSAGSAADGQTLPEGNTDTATGGSEEAAPKPAARSVRPQQRAHHGGQLRVQRAGPRG
ncbi:MAG: hypothetical protein KDB47_12605 [Mycobacterium sp.]|nr:hypothetical protein [Actinomycetota bacterium]MCB1288511.1 hypothetical protein [Mycobacterium sp.]